MNARDAAIAAAREWFRETRAMIEQNRSRTGGSFADAAIANLEAAEQKLAAIISRHLGDVGSPVGDAVGDYWTQHRAEVIAIPLIGKVKTEVYHEVVAEIVDAIKYFQSPAASTEYAAGVEDEVYRRIYAVADAAVEAHQSDEDWPEKENALSAAVESLLELRSKPDAAPATLDHVFTPNGDGDCAMCVLPFSEHPEPALAPAVVHHEHCSIWTVTTSGAKNPCDCVCACGHSMGQHIRPGEHAWYEDCAEDNCPCMKFTAAPAVVEHNHFNTAAIAKGAFPQHIAKDGTTAHYKDGSTLPAVEEPAATVGNCRHNLAICHECMMKEIEAQIAEKSEVAEATRTAIVKRLRAKADDFMRQSEGFNQDGDVETAGGRLRDAHTTQYLADLIEATSLAELLKGEK